MCRQVPSFAPTTISPRGTRSVSAISVRMVLRRSTVSSAYVKNNLPDAVRETRPPERSNRRAPTSSSRARICEEMAGWVRKRFSAAREKLERRATSRKISSWSKSIVSKGEARAWARQRPHYYLPNNSAWRSRPVLDALAVAPRSSEDRDAETVVESSGRIDSVCGWRQKVSCSPNYEYY